jgi:hypothetical protein
MKTIRRAWETEAKMKWDQIEKKKDLLNITVIDMLWKEMKIDIQDWLWRVKQFAWREDEWVPSAWLPQWYWNDLLKKSQSILSDNQLSHV